MGQKLTTYLLAKDNAQTIEAAIKSITWLGGTIVIGDMGSQDGTVEICKKFKTKVVAIRFADDYSEAKNKLISSHESTWRLYLEPWEQLVTGHKIILDIARNSNPCSYYVQVMREQTITKEIRLWSNTLGFSNPVFESIVDKKATLIDGVVIHSQKQPENTNTQKLLDLWKQSQPLSDEPYYYQAYYLLQQSKYNEFVKLANQYVINNTQGMSSVMIRYHLAMVYLYALNEANKALKNILECIATKPLMAEFWCLLGDIYYKTNNYAKAMSLYENAIILGEKRLKDEWPIELKKYKDHPLKMIASCQQIIDNSKVFCMGNSP